MSSLIVSPATLIAALEIATPEEKAIIASLLSVRPLAAEGADAAVEKEEVVACVPKRAGRPKKLKSVFVLPQTADGTAPPESVYRMDPATIVEGVCMARKVVCPDKRWTIAIYAESQCGSTPVGGTDLCAGCIEKKAKYDACPSYHSWNGMITEPPLDWQHMLGTAWAVQNMASGRLRWMGFVAAGGAGDSSASETESVVTTSTVATTPSQAEIKAALKAAKAEEKEAAKAQKAAEKEAKAAEKEASKAAKAAEKEAAAALKAALKIEKDTLKAAKVAEKEALKALKAAEKEALKAAKSVSGLRSGKIRSE